MILGIESSCDESSLALLHPSEFTIRDWTHSQVALHRLYGGVVPDLASREHLTNFPALLELICGEHLLPGRGSVSKVAVTQGPGLAGCLAIGVALAKSIGLFLEAPVVGVNHLRAHAFSPFIPLFLESRQAWPGAMDSLLPHLGLLVSGGNTLLFRIAKDRSIIIEAQTLDDAAGEALDKGAKLLGLGYPGGPEIERAARAGDPNRYRFPRAESSRTREGRCFYSFSGLKTSLRYLLEKMNDCEVEACFGDLCASYQEAVVDQLISKVEQLLTTGDHCQEIRSLGLSGGVANNASLRDRFGELGKRYGLPCVRALPEHTGDNASMIAFCALVDRADFEDETDTLGIEPAAPISLQTAP